MCTYVTFSVPPNFLSLGDKHFSHTGGRGVDKHFYIEGGGQTFFVGGGGGHGDVDKKMGGS